MENNVCDGMIFNLHFEKYVAVRCGFIKSWSNRPLSSDASLPDQVSLLCVMLV